MIRHLKIQNFKSISDAEIELSDFNVVVGANGSGKSNLIKAIEFLGDLARFGLGAAVDRAGGANGVIPKSYSHLKNKPVRIESTVSLPPLDGYPSGQERPVVQYLIEFRFISSYGAIVVHEQLSFTEVFSVASTLDRYFGKKNAAAFPSHGGTVTLTRGPKGGITLDFNPKVTRDNLSGYLTWFGLPFLGPEVRGASGIIKFLRGYVEHRTKRPGTQTIEESSFRYKSLLDPSVPTMVDLASQYHAFRGQLSDIRRYDLLLSELRSEQAVSNEPHISTGGKNVPSVLRRLVSDSQRKASVQSLKATLEEIAPHVGNFSTNVLRTGKEFVEFVENVAGRSVESWESSDGTLRALAILLAVETHSTYGCLLIEEPEQSLHPWAVRTMIDHIRSVSRERALQVVLTTHSEQVLERISPHELWIATRTKAGTEFAKLEGLARSGDIRMGEVGRLWVKGLLGGVGANT